jgi:hypothetical protein
MNTLLFVAAIILFAICIVASNEMYKHKRCKECGSFRTFNWSTIKDEPTLPDTTGDNQYCFKCARLTVRDDSGVGEKHAGLREYIAPITSGEGIRMIKVVTVEFLVPDTDSPRQATFVCRYRRPRYSLRSSRIVLDLCQSSELPHTCGALNFRDLTSPRGDFLHRLKISEQYDLQPTGEP